MAQLKTLEGENKVLLDRWMSQKEKEANQMNEANLFVETYLLSNQPVL